MISFVYLGVGEFDSVSVFKIGKTSNPKQRSASLGIDFTGYMVCLNDNEALALESYLQLKVRMLGAKNLPRRNDWFYYDEELYRQVLDWFENRMEELVGRVSNEGQPTEGKRALLELGDPQFQLEHMPEEVALAGEREILRARVAELEKNAKKVEEREAKYLGAIQTLEDKVNSLQWELQKAEWQVRDAELHARNELHKEQNEFIKGLYREQSEHIEEIYKEHTQEMMKLLREETDLHVQIGYLEGKLSYYEKQDQG